MITAVEILPPNVIIILLDVNWYVMLAVQSRNRDPQEKETWNDRTNERRNNKPHFTFIHEYIESFNGDRIVVLDVSPCPYLTWPGSSCPPPSQNTPAQPTHPRPHPHHTYTSILAH